MSHENKTYFRHDFNARNNPKIARLVCDTSLKREGYFYYYTLCELYAGRCQGIYRDPITFHRQVLKDCWRTVNNKIEKILYTLRQCKLLYYISYEKIPHFFRQEFATVDQLVTTSSPTLPDEFRTSLATCGDYVVDMWPQVADNLATCPEGCSLIWLPSIRDHIGRYSKNVPNKRKEKEIKLNKIKEKENKDKSDFSDSLDCKTITPGEIANAWNQTIGIKIGKVYHSCTFGYGEMHQAYVHAVMHPPLDKIEGWQELFEKCAKSKFLVTGVNGFNLVWLLKGDNLIKTQSGSYDKKDYEDDFNIDEYVK